MRFNRRRFIGFTVGATAGATLGVPASRSLSDLISLLDRPIYPPRGPEDFVLSVCPLCPGGCGVRARRVGGRVVKLEGNSLHPVNRGRLCPKGQAALQSLYHPDRLPGPVRRTGPRGSIRSFEQVSWEDALNEIAGRLRLLRKNGRPESLVLVRGSSREIAARVAARFVRAFGSPNDVRLDRGEQAASMALDLSQGVRGVPAYDLRGAEYVLSFGGSLLEAWSSPVHTMRSFGEFRQGRPGRRGKLVQVEPRLSITAAGADEWVSVLPGTEGILALGIAGVLVAEGLYDRGFVRERTHGFEDFRDAEGNVREGLRTLLERYYSLERVSAVTGVSVNVILRIAREFAAARTGLAVGPRRGPSIPGPLFDHLAAHSLNALTGNVDGPGGLLVPDDVPLPPWPELPADPVSEAARPRLDGVGKEGFPLLHSDPEGLAEAILAGSPYAPEVLMVLGTDPVFECAGTDRFSAALERVPLVVSFASLPDDTALMADWILPDCHFLERWDIDTTPPGVSFPLVSLARPAVEKPLHDVRPTAEVFLDLARRIGAETASAFPWEDYRALIRSEVDGLYEARRGAVMGTSFDEAWARLMERAGWWAPGYRSTEQLWEKMQETGGWWDPFYDHGNWMRVLRTPSGRYEFRTDILQPPPARDGGLPSRIPVGGREDPGPEGTLTLHLFEPLPIAGGTGAALPFLQGILDPGHGARWETWVEIHPESADPLGLRDRDRVRVESPHGSVEARARVTPRVLPGVAAIPIGLGHRSGGRWSSGAGSNPLRLLPTTRDPMSGLPEMGTTRVRVVPATAGEQRPPFPGRG